MRYFITGSFITTLCLKLCLCFSHSEPLPGRSLTMKDGTGKLTLNITSFRSRSNIAWLISQIPLSLLWQRKSGYLGWSGIKICGLKPWLHLPPPPPPQPPPLPPSKQLSFSLCNCKETPYSPCTQSRRHRGQEHWAERPASWWIVWTTSWTAALYQYS